MAELVKKLGLPQPDGFLYFVEKCILSSLDDSGDSHNPGFLIHDHSFCKLSKLFLTLSDSKYS